MATPNPPDPGDALDCEQARVLLPRHAQGALASVEQARFRAHILGCADCRDAYRTAIATTAQVGRGLADAKLERLRRERRIRARGLPFRVGSFGRNRRAYWLRAMLGTALLITLVTRLPGWARAPQLEATWEHGGVLAGTKELAASDRDGPLVTGDWVVTQANGAARVAGHGGEAELGAGSALLVEDPRDFRVRFRRGVVTVAGEALVATEFGFARLDGGRVRFTSTVEGLELSVEAGELEWTHPGGVEQYASGAAGLVRVPGPLLARR